VMTGGTAVRGLGHAAAASVATVAEARRIRVRRIVELRGYLDDSSVLPWSIATGAPSRPER
jgi:hypothetical protein